MINDSHLQDGHLKCQIEWLQCDKNSVHSHFLFCDSVYSQKSKRLSEHDINIATNGLELHEFSFYIDRIESRECIMEPVSTMFVLCAKKTAAINKHLIISEQCVEDIVCHTHLMQIDFDGMDCIRMGKIFDIVTAIYDGIQNMAEKNWSQFYDSVQFESPLSVVEALNLLCTRVFEIPYSIVSKSNVNAKPEE